MRSAPPDPSSATLCPAAGCSRRLRLPHCRRCKGAGGEPTKMRAGFVALGVVALGTRAAGECRPAAPAALFLGAHYQVLRLLSQPRVLLRFRIMGHPAARLAGSGLLTIVMIGVASAACDKGARNVALGADAWASSEYKAGGSCGNICYANRCAFP